MNKDVQSQCTSQNLMQNINRCNCNVSYCK